MKLSVILATCVVMLGSSAVWAQAPVHDQKWIENEIRKADLFHALTVGDPEGVKAALKRGVDPNCTNSTITAQPLLWAALASTRANVETLLAAGARLNQTGPYGNCVTCAVVGRHEELALALLAKGASPNEQRVDGATALSLAAADGQGRLVLRLLAMKVNPNQQDRDGATPLIWAARRNQSAMVEALIASGAKVDLADSHGRTPLMYASMNGFPAVVSTLLQHRAKPELRDQGKATALLLAARYSGDQRVIRALLNAGASAADVDASGKCGWKLASSRRYDEAAAMLRAKTPSALLAQARATNPISVSRRIQNSIGLIQTSIRAFQQRTNCASCHQEGLALVALGAAKDRGFAVDGKVIEEALQRIGSDSENLGPVLAQIPANPEIAKLAPAYDIGDLAPGSGYIFAGMHAVGVPGNPGLAGPAMLIAQNQERDGSWRYYFHREPMQSNFATISLFALKAMNAYAPPEAAPMIEQARVKARAFLLGFRAETAEIAAARVLALQEAGASAGEVSGCARELVALQRPDGGWSQTPSTTSDAYVTGMAVYALHKAAGLPATEPAVARGVQFLLRTQDEDGSWYVNKRCMPGNTYFNAGFPHGQSQFSSFAGTAWAVMALTETSPAQGKTASR